MSNSRPTLQTWFAVFVVVTGVVSLLPYRERALLTAPGSLEQGLLAQEISQHGAGSLVSDLIGSSPVRLHGAVQGRGPGKQRATEPSAVMFGSARSPMALSEDAPLGFTGVPQGGGPAFALGGDGEPDGPSKPVGGGQSPFQAPPVVQAAPGTTGELLGSAVPEPATWVLFTAGLLALAHGLRRASGVRVRTASAG